MGKQIGLALIILLLSSCQYLSATLIFEESGQRFSALGSSNSKVVDDIEYYFELDKSVYVQGENVEMLYRVTNLKDENFTFRFSCSGQKNFLVNKNDINIWQAYDACYLGVTEFTLTPSEIKTFTYIWDMKINQNELLGVGQYNVIGRLDIYPGLYDYTKVGVSMEVVPEPITVIFLALGALRFKHVRFS